MNLKLQPCLPPFWAKNGHLQTILGHLIPSPRPIVASQSLNIPLSDGDQLSALYYSQDSDVIIVAWHGLTGSVDSSYMQRTAVIGLELGCSVLLVNHRGCGSGRDLAKSPYHSGRGEDISQVVEYVQSVMGYRKNIVIGFSLGANALLTLLTGLRGTVMPDAALVVNAPVDLQATSLLIQRGWNRIYDFNFVQGCRRDIEYKVKNKLISEKVRIPFWSYLDKVDELYTAPQSGFKDKEDYYASCSTYNRLQNIKTPTVIITAKDDPFIPWQPYLGALRNPNVSLHIENTGGHLGYLSKKGAKGPLFRWLDYATKEVILNFQKML